MNGSMSRGGFVHPRAAWCDAECRPVVVIDPESSAADELADMLTQSLTADDINEGIRSAVRSSLREMARPTPPKPDEPTGLGAVVRDVAGDLYTRYDAHDPQPWWWNSVDPEAPVARRYGWHDFAAVEVLSEGVQP